ncbi:hypothetical protein Q7P37_008745 [Cladosporium fusiforme]
MDCGMIAGLQSLAMQPFPPILKPFPLLLVTDYARALGEVRWGLREPLQTRGKARVEDGEVARCHGMAAFTNTRVGRKSAEAVSIGKDWSGAEPITSRHQPHLGTVFATKLATLLRILLLAHANQQSEDVSQCWSHPPVKHQTSDNSTTASPPPPPISARTSAHQLLPLSLVEPSEQIVEHISPEPHLPPPPTFATMSIQRLPTELVEQIIEHISPETHLSFALTSQRHLQCSRHILARHQQCVINRCDIMDVFGTPSRPEDPVEAWHTPACVVYRGSSIAAALQISGLRSLEMRRFVNSYGRLEFDESQVSKDVRSSIEDISFIGVRDVRNDQLNVLFRSIKALKAIRVERCSFATLDTLVEKAILYHSKTLEVLYLGETQFAHGCLHQLYYTPLLSRLENIHDLVVHLFDINQHTRELRENKSGLDDPAHLCQAIASILLPSLRRLEVWSMFHADEDTIEWSNVLDKAFASTIEMKDPPNLRILNLSKMQIASPMPYYDRYTVPYARTLVLKPYESNRSLIRYLKPRFPATIEVGHRLGILVETVYHYKTTCCLFGARPWTEHDMRRYLARGEFQDWEALGDCGSFDCKTCLDSGVAYRSRSFARKMRTRIFEM